MEKDSNYLQVPPHKKEEVNPVKSFSNSIMVEDHLDSGRKKHKSRVHLKSGVAVKELDAHARGEKHLH